VKPWPLLASLCLLAACSAEPDPVVVSDDDSERIQALGRKVQELEAELRANVVGDREAAELRKRLGDMEREVRSLREQLAAAPTRPAGTEPGPAPTDPSTSGPGPQPYVPPAPAGSDGSFSEDQIASFRRLEEEVNRRKEIEQRTQRIKTQLERAQVSLSPEVETAVISRTLSQQEAVQKVFRAGFGRTDAERAENTEKLEGMRAEYERDIRGIVPGDSADKVVEALGRAFPGTLRRIDGSNVRNRNR
jgi:DNA repair exonuclease SbcCD ATPase subunit